MANSVKELGSNKTRLGTYDAKFEKIGKWNYELHT